MGRATNLVISERFRTFARMNTKKGDSLKEKTARGLLWGALNNGAMQFIGLAFGILLGRMLNPDDYGFISMITIFTVIAGALQESGFGKALVNLDEPTDTDCNAVFWFNILVGGACYVILFLCAPLIARYYHHPILVPLSRYAFLSILFSSFGIVQSALLQKHLMVKQRSKANISAVLLSSSVGAIMAWRGFAYWSLATQTNLYILLNTVFYWHYSPWRPSLKIDFSPIKRMFGFSFKVLATTIITQINNNILNILLGRYFTARDTGNYNQAYQWNSKVVYLLQGMVNSVTQPVMVDLRSNLGRQQAALRKLVRFTAFLSFPMVLGFGLVSREFILITLTAKWLTSASYLRILCIGGAFLPISTLFSEFILSHGKSGTIFWCTLALFATQLSAMLLAYPWGIQLMIWLIVAINIVWAFIWYALSSRLVSYSLWMFLADVMPFALAAAAVMTLTWLITSPLSSPWLLLISRIITAALLYYGLMKVARVKILDECLNFLLKKHKGKDRA